MSPSNGTMGPSSEETSCIILQNWLHDVFLIVRGLFACITLAYYTLINVIPRSFVVQWVRHSIPTKKHLTLIQFILFFTESPWGTPILDCLHDAVPNVYTRTRILHSRDIQDLPLASSSIFVQHFLCCWFSLFYLRKLNQVEFLNQLYTRMNAST